MMMVRYRSRSAKKNLREGIRKMEEESMTPAARVRREFRLGRPPKAIDTILPLHPIVVWTRATEALARFRSMMKASELKPDDVGAVIVYITSADPDQPYFLLMDEEGRSTEEIKNIVLEKLSRPDAIALGMLFRQFDVDKKQQSTFPYQFTGLNERGVAILKKAAELQVQGAALISKES